MSKTAIVNISSQLLLNHHETLQHFITYAADLLSVVWCELMLINKQTLMLYNVVQNVLMKWFGHSVFCTLGLSLSVWPDIYEVPIRFLIYDKMVDKLQVFLLFESGI